MNFTLVSTIFNESKRLSQTIADLEAQTVQPSEFIITDAGSNDGSWQMLQDWKQRSNVPIVLLQENRCNVARGRNLAIEVATYDLIVSTDFGCRFNATWLEDLTRPFVDTTVEVVGGAYSVDESSIMTLAAKANYLLTNGYNVDIKSWFIPSSRSIAYYKKVWEKVGRYPEWLTLAADDLVFGMKLQSFGYKWAIAPQPNVLWLRHNSATQYAKESYRYGLGDGEARVNVRNTIITGIEQLLKLSFLCSAVLLPVSLFAFLPLIFSLIGFRAYYQVYRNWVKHKSEKYDIKTFLFSIYLFEKNRFNYLQAYCKGYFSSRTEVKVGRTLLHEQLRVK